jgi:alkylation response protein AidB-like acyl-CoA dehydrogenase
MSATLVAGELIVGEEVGAEEFVEPVADDIRSMAAEAEALRRMPDRLLTRLKDAGLLSIYTPKEFGGLDLPLPDALRVVEEVSRHDGSTGWTVALGVGNSLFTCMLSESSAARVLGDGAVLIAGAPAFGVRAMPVAGGYRLTGRWGFNIGAPNADWIAAPAPIFDGDSSRMGPGGGPQMAFAFLPPSEVQIIDTWYVTGLRATGTQDLYVEDVFVPDEMTGDFSMPDGPHAVRHTVVARIPFFTLAGMVQAPPVCLGLARRGIDEFRQLALTKQSPFGPPLREQVRAHVGLARAEALLRSARSYWYAEVQRVWDRALQGCEFALDDRAGARIASLMAVEQSVAAVDLLYRLAVSSAIFQASPLERCWRDVHTAAQHVQVQDGRWETAGRVLLGLEPGSPLL